MDSLLTPYVRPEDQTWKESSEGDIEPVYEGINGPQFAGQLPGVEVEEISEAYTATAEDAPAAKEVVLLDSNGAPDPELTEKWQKRQQQKVQAIERTKMRVSPVSRIAGQNNAARHEREHNKRVHKQVR